MIFRGFIKASVFYFLLSFFALQAAYAHELDSSGNPLQPVSIQVKWNHQFQFAGYYAALKKGYYREAGIDVILKDKPEGSTIVKEVVAGRTDFGVSYGTAIADYINGAPIKVVMASFQVSPMVLLSHHPVNNLSELAGKSVMHENNFQIAALLKKVGAPVENVPVSANLQDFIDKKVDFYSAYASNEMNRLDKLGVPYSVIDPKTYGIQSYGDLLITSEKFASSNPILVESIKKATIKGWDYALKNPEEIVDFIIENYPVVKDRKALLEEASAIPKYVQLANKELGDVNVIKLMATALEQQNLGLIPAGKLSEANLRGFVFDTNTLLYTPEELAYMATNPVVKIANDIDWEPFEYVEDGILKGLSADYLKLLTAKLGIEFKPVTDQKWAEVVDAMSDGSLDMYSCATSTPERREHAVFTKPYLSFPMVLIGLKSVGYIHDFDYLEGLRVAVVKGYWSDTSLAARNQNIELVRVDSVREGLEAVLERRADVYSGNLGVINYAIKQYGLDGLHVVGQSKDRFELAMGVQKNNPLLLSVIKKGLSQISEAERQAIYNRWFPLEVVQKLDEKQLVQVMAVPLLIVVGLLMLIFIFRYQKNKNQDYINRIHELTYATLIEPKTLNFKWISESYLALTGFSREELQQKSYLQMVAQGYSEQEKSDIIACVISGEQWSGEIQGVNANGESYWVELTLTPGFNWFKKVVGIWATRVDITDKKRAEEMAIKDDLTGLYNRRYFNQVIETEMNRTKRENLPLSVAMIDIDWFKKVNDTYGHEQGDVVLQQIAHKLSENFNRASDLVFRMGGEEFFVLSHFESPGIFENYLNHLRQQVQQAAIENKDAELGVVTISIGACYVLPHQLPSKLDVYHLADEALYDAKEIGRNKVVICLA